ncbi:hypothetical protein NHG32_07005 [Aerococcaceae bacterium NML191219]|nr:hypothetical protein [Aerococcaceae bacterium NML191219]
MTENIKQALEYAVVLARREQKIVKDENGVEYYDADRHNLVMLEPKEYYPDTLKLSTLSSLVKYYKDNLNNINQQKTIIVVETPTLVSVYTEDDSRKKRTKLLSVTADVVSFNYGMFHSQEEFIISMQSKFVNSGDREIVIDYASKLAVQDGADLEDDGISQVTTVKSGVASKSKAVAPNPVRLKPYRTFNEVEQPDSNFVFRINKHAQMALFEADGGAWTSEAKRNVAEYLTKELQLYKDAIVLA